MRVAGNAAGIEVGLLVANRTAHGRNAKTVRAPFDRRLVRPTLFALAWPIAGRMAVDAARIGQHFAELGEQRRRPCRGVVDRGKALRRCEAILTAVGNRVRRQDAHQQSRGSDEKFHLHPGQS